MQFTRLGHTGLIVSRLCLGCMSFGDAARSRHTWVVPEADSRAIIRAALESGINFFDTANEYAGGSSEEITGRALNDFARRDEIVLATKAFAPWRGAPNTGGLSRKALFQAIDDSLKRLGTDYVDLFQIHRWDYNTPIEETMEALHDIVKSGRARYIGASSMFAWQFAKAQHVAALNRWTRFVSMQPQVNLIYREEEREMIPQCTDMGVAVLPWSPLARGMLTRPPGAKTTRSETDLFSKYLYARTEENDRLVIEAVQAVAAEAGVPMARIALAWLLGKAGITAPIVGVTRTGQLDDALAALNLTLSAAQMERLEAPYVPHPVAGLAPPIAPGGTVSVGADR
ncbi:MAG: aldo/keto reductase [Novosphingobium sp.]|nr:aldo/keto reductase [Novosphingobium sp.]